MKIRELTIRGFRSLKEVSSWKPGALNVVIGPNGTGKSNLLRVLELVALSADGRLGRHIQASGGMEPLLWDGSAPAIDVRIKTSPLGDDRDPEKDCFTYHLELTRVGSGSAYRVGRELLGNFYRVETGAAAQPFKFIERSGPFARVFDAEQKALVAPEADVPDDETLLSLAKGPFSVNPLIPPFRAQLASWCVYHDVHVNRDAVIRQPVVARLEKRVDPDGQNLIQVLHTLYTGDRDFKREIDVAMRAAFSDDYDELVFPPAADQRIQLRVRWRSLRREQSAADLSDGTLRFLFLLTVLASPAAAPVIAIDEPETGLHPAMLPIVAEYAVEAARHSQVILTTHSPQFLDAFEGVQPTTTVATWADGESHVKILKQEALAAWLEGYSLGALFKSGELEEME